jgi:hypothetical protein
MNLINRDVIDAYDILQFERYGSGHIHQTYLTKSSDGKEYIIQKINTTAFKNVEKLMENIELVTTFLKAEHILSLTIVPNRKNKKNYFISSDGTFWRCFIFIENSIDFQIPENKNIFSESASAFAKFTKSLINFDANLLYETIKDFHNTKKRILNFENSISNDPKNRVKNIKKEIEFYKVRKNEIIDIFDNELSKLPARVTHNDTKLNNVLFDKDTKKAICVIDLDTIMKGLLINDFGDSIRFGASTAPEDEQNLDKVNLSVEMFRVYTNSYLNTIQDVINKNEKKLLVFGAKLMTYECGLRFLTDYIDGDIYFSTNYSEHNLIRCKTQIKLVKEIENKYKQLENIVNNFMP